MALSLGRDRQLKRRPRDGRLLVCTRVVSCVTAATRGYVQFVGNKRARFRGLNLIFSITRKVLNDEGSSAFINYTSAANWEMMIRVYLPIE